MKTPKELTLEDAQKIAEQSDYAFAASETECNPINWGDASAFVLEGYKACFAELTRWNSIKESLPSDSSVVLCKYHNDDPNEVSYCVCQFVSGWFYTSDNNSLDEEDEPTHWREIHE